MGRWTAAQEKITAAREAVERTTVADLSRDELVDRLTAALGLMVEALDETLDVALAAAERAGVPQDVEL